MPRNETNYGMVAQNLKVLREANRFTQEDVANYLGITRSAYSNYESGIRDISLELLEKIADLFGCELDAFFENDVKVLENILMCSFRVDQLSCNDLKQVARFKQVVLSYMKINRLLLR